MNTTEKEQETPAGDSTNLDEAKTEANQVIALGAAVGITGGVAGLIVGAVCPLCYFVAPGLIGMGVVGRIRAAKKEKHLRAVAQEGKNNGRE